MNPWMEFDNVNVMGIITPYKIGIVPTMVKQS